MPRIYVRQFTILHIAKCHSTKSWIMSRYFPWVVSGIQYAHQYETIDTTVPLQHGVTARSRKGPKFLCMAYEALKCHWTYLCNRRNKNYWLTYLLTIIEWLINWCFTARPLTWDRLICSSLPGVVQDLALKLRVVYKRTKRNGKTEQTLKHYILVINTST